MNVPSYHLMVLEDIDTGSRFAVVRREVDGVEQTVEERFLDAVMRLRAQDDEAFQELWHLTDLLLDRLPQGEGLEA